MTLGNAAAAQFRLMVQACGHQVEPDPVEMVATSAGHLSLGTLSNAYRSFPTHHGASCQPITLAV
jgi:hypothetical protein